jgi:Ras-related protein Rab-11A
VASVNGIKLFLIGNKAEMVHLKVIETSEISDFSRQNQLNFSEVSCLNGKNVERSFNQFMVQIVTDILFKEGKQI